MTRKNSSQFPIERVQEDFPVLKQKVHGKDLIYLDNAATTQKPESVIRTMNDYYSTYNSNIHRGVHALSEKATRAYENSRKKIQKFIHASDSREIIFLRGATEAINLVAQTFGKKKISAGDEIIISEMEHHSNIVPWQMLCQETGATLKTIPINDEGDLILSEFEKLLNQRTKLVAIAHVSNALGTINPIRTIIEAAHRNGTPVLLDGAQAAPHLAVDVQELDCDFYTFSGHKIYGPTGIGVLYGKAKYLEEMPPYQGGGDMILSVSFKGTTCNSIPFKFEAGTPDIAGAIGLGAAIDYLESIGMESIAKYEDDLLNYATDALTSISHLHIIGAAKKKAAVLSFTLEGIHPHDIGTVLDQEGIAIRTGHHCAQPLMERFGIPATARASLAFYNTRSDVDALISGIGKVKEVFR